MAAAATKLSRNFQPLGGVNATIGQFMCALRAVTVTYCPEGGSSAGMRDYINKGIVKFATEHPTVTVVARKIPLEHPEIRAEFVNDVPSSTTVVKNISAQEIAKKIAFFTQTSGPQTTEKIGKYWRTQEPSIQGAWHPFLNEHVEQKQPHRRSPRPFKMVKK